MSGGAAIPMLDHPGTPSGSKFNKNLNASAQVIGPGTNEYHTKFLTLTWGGVDIRKALAAGKNYRIFLYCYFFENIQPITPFGKAPVLGRWKVLGRCLCFGTLPVVETPESVKGALDVTEEGTVDG